ncbi:MAG: hypothetical protein ACYC5K_09665 [Saccharofermentanales bacterium]
MGQTVKIILQVLGILVLAVGVFIVYAAPRIVEKRGLDEKKTIDADRAAGLSEEEIKKLKRESAILDLKIKGVLVALPGAILILIMYKL